LWQRYFGRLVELARRRLQGAPRRAADEEDVALSAFDSFCRGAAAGRFPRLDDRDDLWQVLVLVTARKAIDLVHHERRRKRGGGRVLDEGAGAPVLDQIVGREPSPAFVAELAEELGRRVAAPDAQLRAIALLKLEGYTSEEIGERLGCAVRTVRRWLGLIRDTWQQEQPP
jgi:DNA-directed RNA polymerase specialized sigma24 family protein